MSTFPFLVVSRDSLSSQTQVFLFFCLVCAPKAAEGAGGYDEGENVFFLAGCCKLSFYANES